MSDTYQVYTLLDPRPEDAPKLRRMWAVVKRQKHNYEFRRRLAHDYWLAKCSGKKREGGLSDG